MAKSKIICDFCKLPWLKANGHINRAKKVGAPLYCCLECGYMARTSNLDLEQKRVNKRSYDVGYRSKNLEKLKARKAAYYKKTRDPEKESLKRKTPEYKEYRRQYLSTAKYKNYKHKYDRVHRCKKEYGEYWEAASICIDIDIEVKARKSSYQIRLENKTLNKTLQRSRNGSTKRSYT